MKRSNSKSKLSLHFKIPKIDLSFIPNSNNIPPPKPNNIIVPPIIHWIWLGSVLNRDKISNLIQHVVNKSTGFKYILWVDNGANYYRIKEELPYFFPRKDKLYLANKIEVKVIKEQAEMINSRAYTSFMRESVGGYRNYASASDILRLMILYHFGGLYLDVDVEIQDEYKLHPYAVQSPYGFSLQEILLGVSRGDKIPNAIIATAPKHPWIKLMLDNIVSNYFKQPEQDYMSLVLGGNINTRVWSSKRSGLLYLEGKSVPNPFSHGSDSGSSRFDETLEFTGPGLLLNILKTHNLVPYVKSIGNFFKEPDGSGKWTNINPYATSEWP
ncbi:TcdA/TcdB catalytic glycosyltransferase domain-containing protein [Enterobacteriaceae bacterium LUAb1]